MSASASGDEVVLPDRAGRAVPGAGRQIRVLWAEVALAVIAFAALCVVVVSVAPQSAEPDDGAYRASIVAMTEGHFLTLSAAQAEALARKLGDNPAAPPNQWVELSDGRYISEKDPVIRSSRRRSRSSGSSAGRRCSTGHSPASASSSGPGAG